MNSCSAINCWILKKIRSIIRIIFQFESHYLTIRHIFHSFLTNNIERITKIIVDTRFQILSRVFFFKRRGEENNHLPSFPSLFTNRLYVLKYSRIKIVSSIKRKQYVQPMQIIRSYNFTRWIHRSSKKKKKKKEKRKKRKIQNSEHSLRVYHANYGIRIDSLEVRKKKRKKKKPIHDASRAKVTEVLRSRGKKSEQYTDNPNNTCRRERKKSRETW